MEPFRTILNPETAQDRPAGFVEQTLQMFWQLEDSQVGNPNCDPANMRPFGELQRKRIAFLCVNFAHQFLGSAPIMRFALYPIERACNTGRFIRAAITHLIPADGYPFRSASDVYLIPIGDPVRWKSSTTQVTPAMMRFSNSRRFLILVYLHFT